jgi:hypothetical protein
MTPFDVAQRHIAVRDRLTDAAVADALRWWYRINPQQLDGGWNSIAAALAESVTRSQVEAATQATPYMALVRGHDRTPAVADVVPEAFGGVTKDGREIGPAMFGAVTTTKKVIATGRTADEAFRVGASWLATVVGSAVQDMGRQADIVAGVGSKRTYYVRVLSPGACSRCAVLAGKSSGAVPFKRHPRCRCGAWPVKKGASIPDGLTGDPGAYFESLSAADQNRIFTDAGAEAIRHGADVGQVVNARRGAYGIGFNARVTTPTSVNRLQPVTIGQRSDGTPLTVYATTEGTTARGLFGRRSTTVRLMPEQIAVMAGGDPLRWIELLHRYGYLI